MPVLIQGRSLFLCSSPNAHLCGHEWLLLLFLYIAVCGPPPVRAQTNSTDATAMEALKSSLFPTSSSALQAQNWTSSSDVCGFTSCGPPSCSTQTIGLMNGAAGDIPVCNWSGVCCTSWDVTGISLLEPAISFSTFQRSLPEALSQMQNLQVLQLPKQGLSGPLPSQIVANMSSLRELDLSNNQFTGFLPSSWGNVLASINLANNSLEGHVPQTWHATSQMGTLYQLNLGDNSGLCNLASGSALAIAGKPTCSAALLREQSRLDPASGIYTATPPPPPVQYPNEPVFLDTSPSQTYNTPSPESAAGVPSDAVKYAAVGVVLGLGMLTLVAILVRRHIHHLRNQTSTVRRGDIPLQRRRLSDPAVPTPSEPQSPPCLVLGPDGHTLALATESLSEPRQQGRMSISDESSQSAMYTAFLNEHEIAGARGSLPIDMIARSVGRTFSRPHSLTRRM